MIREAVKTLAAKGLLESKTRTGIRALPPVRWNLLDSEVLSWRYSAMPPVQFFAELFEIREMIEPEAAALAAIRATPADIEEIETAFKAMVEASQADTPGVEADLRFHRGILAAGRNPLLLQMGNLISVGLLISHRFSRESFAIFLPMHSKVMEAIKAGDSRPGAQGDAPPAGRHPRLHEGPHPQRLAPITLILREDRFAKRSRVG